MGCLGLVVLAGGGMEMGMSGLDMRFEIWVAWRERAVALGLWAEGVGRSFLLGRWEGCETEVGIDSGIGSDMLVALKRSRLKAKCAGVVQ